MKIRRATTEDAKNIASVAITTWVDTYAPEGMNDIYSEYVLDRFTAENVSALINEHYVLVAETDFGIVGYALVSKSSEAKSEIETVYILPKFQGVGVGKALMDAIVASHNNPLWLKCADYNPKALSFYRNFGFIETGETWFLLAGERYRCLVFELSHNKALKAQPSAAGTPQSGAP